MGAGLGLALHLPCFLFPGFGRVGALFQLGVLLFQAADVGKSGFVAAFCFFPLFRVLMGLSFSAFHQLLEIGIFLAGVLSGLLGRVGTVFFGFELGQQLLHPLAVSGSCGELFSTARAGDQVQVLARNRGQ